MAACLEQVLTELNRIVPADSARTGGLYELMLDYPLRSGKGMRPALCMATAQALGAGPLEAVPTASVFELYHNAFLIHDDVEDASLMRRGGPTLSATHGESVAINVGDGMLAIAMQPLLENTEHLGLARALRILRVVARMAAITAEGQAIELRWTHGNTFEIDFPLYYRVIFKKTAWYTFIAPVLAACVIARRDQLGKPLGRFATLLGLAFQIQDDVLNLAVASQDARHGYGKERAGDLWEGKVTLILLHAMSQATRHELEQVRKILGKQRPPTGAPTGAPDTKGPDDIAFLLDLIERCGAVDYAWAQAQRRAHRASRILETCDALRPGAHRDFLFDLVGYVINRDR
jgi:geranylgeranyl diphosphate synthase type II